MQICQLEVFSHGVKITGIEVSAMQVLREYALQLVQYKVEKVRQRFIRTAERVFAAATADRGEWRFHRHELPNLLEAFKSRGYLEGQHLKVIYVPDHPIAKIDVSMPKGWAPREEQLPIIEYGLADGRTKVITMQTGTGKCALNTELVRIPGGWKPMGEICVGDYVVTPEGTPTRVNAVFPQPERELLKVTFWDGRYSVVTPDHLWKVYYINTTIKQRWRVVTTEEMLRLLSMANPRVYVPLIDPEEQPVRDFVIPPYTLGTILGDGGLSSGGVKISKYDEQLKSRIENELPESMELRQNDAMTFSLSSKVRNAENPYRDELKRLGLWGKRSWEKHIPVEYLETSIEQRLQLLQGLMDTDGTSGKAGDGGSGSISYSSTSWNLITGVQYLVRSLGGLATISRRFPKYTYKGEVKEGRPAWVLNIRMKKPTQAFSLDRKKERVHDDGQYSDILKLRVRSVTPYGLGMSTCISVDNPDSLYVTNDFIVTHNTATSLKIVSLIGHRLMVTVLGRYLEKWKSDLIENYGLKPQELVVVRGQKQLHALLEAAHLGQLPTQLAAVLITTDTMVDYIDLYEKTKFVAMPKYLVPPERIYEVLSVGIRIIDECHQNFHANFKMDLYTHIDKGIYLSATLESDNQFIDKMYRIAYPMHLRMDGGKYQQYCNVVNVEYQLEDSRKVRFKNAKGQYSQNDYESWIMKDPGRLKNYLELIWNIAKVEYLSDYVEGQRLLILAGRTEMCSVIANYIDGRLADHTVSKYTSAEDYDVLMNSDVSVSTYGSAGTAVDIADLTTCICTIAMSASQGNLQILGRLRKLKRWPHRNPKFIYLTCLDVPPHRTYHEKKLALFKGKALSHTSMTSRFRV